MTLGTKLRKLRQEQKLSMLDMAAILEVSKSTIALWESDKTKPGIDHLLKIFDHFQMDIYQLFEQVDNVDFSHAVFDRDTYAGNLNNFTINNHAPPELVQDLAKVSKMIQELLGKLKAG